MLMPKAPTANIFTSGLTFQSGGNTFEAGQENKEPAMLVEHPAFRDGPFATYFFEEAGAGLFMIIAEHKPGYMPRRKTKLGGIRMWRYSVEKAIANAIRLSRAMTYKSLWADTGTGGAKSVIIGDPWTDKTEALLLAAGRAIESLGGLYTGGEDVGISAEDVDIIERETPHVCGGTQRSGDPSPYTVEGVKEGIRVCLRRVFGTGEVAGRTFAVQGIGHTGLPLVEWLHEEDARMIFVADVDESKTRALLKKPGIGQSLRITPLSPDAIHQQEVDVFAPCALANAVREDTDEEKGTREELRCKIVAGTANNVLRTRGDGVWLHKRGILYAPDFVINAGGLISVSRELFPEGHDAYGNIDWMKKRIYIRIPENLEAIFALSERDNISPHDVAMMGPEKVFGALGITESGRMPHDAARRSGVVSNH